MFEVTSCATRQRRPALAAQPGVSTVSRVLRHSSPSTPTLSRYGDIMGQDIIRVIAAVEGGWAVGGERTTKGRGQPADYPQQRRILHLGHSE